MCQPHEDFDLWIGIGRCRTHSFFVLTPIVVLRYLNRTRREHQYFTKVRIAILVLAKYERRLESGLCANVWCDCVTILYTQRSPLHRASSTSSSLSLLTHTPFSPSSQALSSDSTSPDFPRPFSKFYHLLFSKPILPSFPSRPRSLSSPISAIINSVRLLLGSGGALRFHPPCFF